MIAVSPYLDIGNGPMRNAAINYARGNRHYPAAAAAAVISNIFYRRCAHFQQHHSANIEFLRTYWGKHATDRSPTEKFYKILANTSVLRPKPVDYTDAELFTENIKKYTKPKIPLDARHKTFNNEKFVHIGRAVELVLNYLSGSKYFKMLHFLTGLILVQKLID